MVIKFSRKTFIPLGQAGEELYNDTAIWRDTRGYTLSDRLWFARQSDRNAIDAILRGAVVSGEDPLKAARRMEDYLLPAGRPVRDPKTGRLVRWKKDEAGNLLRDASGKLIPAQPKGAITRTPRSGAGSYAARRLARTEVSRAFELGGQQASALNPFVDRRRWNLSGGHDPKEDNGICARNAQGSSHGQEPGVYFLSEYPGFPAHPQDKCFGTPVTVDDTDAVIAQLRSDFDLGDGPPLNDVFQSRQPSRARKLVTTLFRVARALAGREAA